MGTTAAQPTDAKSLSDVVDTLASAHLRGHRVRPAGAASWTDAWGLEGGVPAAPYQTLSVLGLDDIVEYEPADLTMTVGAGVSLERIGELTRPNRQWLALDPVVAAGATIGATVATASAGGLITGFGGPRDHVLGCTMVTGDGRVLELGGRVVKNVAGFDLLKLMVGGWGRFGVLTQVTVRLNPLPARDITLIYDSEDVSQLGAGARALATAPIVPAALRLVLGGRSPRLAARVVGGDASAPTEADRLEAAVSALPLVVRREEGEASKAVWSQQQVAPEPTATELEVHFVPSQLPAMVPMMIQARDAGWRLHCDVAEGLCVVEGVDAPLEPIAAWTGAGATVRVLRAEGSTRDRLRGVEAASEPTIRSLVERLTNAFDPSGVLG